MLESLRWNWRLFPDASRRLLVELRTGSRYETVLEDLVAAP